MKAIIVDKCSLIRKGLLSVLASNNHFKEVYELKNTEEVESGVYKYNPDIAILGIESNYVETYSIIEKFKKSNNMTKFIIMAPTATKDSFQKAKEVGVEGYILKNAVVEDIMYAIDSVARNRKFYDYEVVKSVEENRNKLGDILTAREQEIFCKIAQGLSNNQIGKVLFISENTVKKHVSNILSKLNISHRNQIILLEAELGSSKEY